MAKSKSGGTRSYIRGKIGADVYSVGKDGKGKRQQVVRSLAEQVANPQTEAQMFGRMVMSTVMQGVAEMKGIIDHSFDGIPAGQPSISEFIRRNYALIKADAEAHPASGNVFGLVKYQQKGVRPGEYIISKGNVVVPSGLVFTESDMTLTITLSATAHKVSDLKAALGMGSGDDYFTFCAIGEGSTIASLFQFYRFRVDDTLTDDTDITSSNIAQVFAVEGNNAPTIAINNNVITLTPANHHALSAGGVIVSRKNADGWQHSTCTLKLNYASPSFSASVALPTYPQGSARFLNGGDI